MWGGASVQASYTNHKSQQTELNMAELKHAIMKLKKGKAVNDIPITLIQYVLDGKDFARDIIKLYQTVWITNIIPIYWGRSILNALWSR